MKKELRLKLEQEYIDKKTPFDNEIKNTIKELADSRYNSLILSNKLKNLKNEADKWKTCTYEEKK